MHGPKHESNSMASNLRSRYLVKLKYRTSNQGVSINKLAREIWHIVGPLDVS
jgi:hypothetical protein